MAQFNSVEYAWKDLQVSLLGRLLVRILEIEVEPSVEHKEIYGRGSLPVAIQSGNYSFKGKLKIGQSEYNEMVRTAQDAGKRVTDISFDISIAYVNGDGIWRNRVVGAKTTGAKQGMKQGDTDMEIELPFVALDFLENVEA